MSLQTQFVYRQCKTRIHAALGHCSVVGAIGSIGHGFESAHRLFSHYSASLQQAEITDEVLTGRFSTSTAVVHSASYPLGMANRVAAYQW